MSDFIQPFPDSSKLRGLSLPNLKRRLRSTTGDVHSYVVRSVKLNRATKHFAQKGSAPNFQAGYITLCTCKHQMRATQPAESWRGPGSPVLRVGVSIITGCFTLFRS